MEDEATSDAAKMKIITSRKDTQLRNQKQKKGEEIMEADKDIFATANIGE